MRLSENHARALTLRQRRANDSTRQFGSGSEDLGVGAFDSTSKIIVQNIDHFIKNPYLEDDLRMIRSHVDVNF